MFFKILILPDQVETVLIINEMIYKKIFKRMEAVEKNYRLPDLKFVE
jgi:hypothetical protein